MAITSYEQSCETPNDAERTLMVAQMQANEAFGILVTHDVSPQTYLHLENRYKLDGFLRAIAEGSNTSEESLPTSRNEFAALITYKLLREDELAGEVTAGFVLDIARTVGPEFDDTTGSILNERLDRAGDYYDEHPGLRGNSPALSVFKGQLDELLELASAHVAAGRIFQANAEFSRQVWATSLAVLEEVDRIKLQ